MKFCRTICAAALLAAAPLCAAGVREGLDALAKRDFAEARRQFEAAQGEPDALYQLGLMYLNGYGDPRDPAKAVGYFERASAAGHQEATVLYARALMDGAGIAKDEAKGIRLVAKLAGEGHARSQVVYGTALEFGLHGLEKDPKAAIEWYRKAMDAGNVEGTVYYANALAIGNGIDKDEAKAAELLKKSADDGHTLGMVAYGQALRAGRGVAKDEAEAFKLFQQAADKGYSEGQYEVGTSYLFGRGVGRDPREAARWIDAAARQGSLRAQRMYGELYRTGSGVPVNRVEAYKWYTIAAARSGGTGDSANQARVTLAQTMSSGEIAEAERRATAFSPQRGVRPSTAKPVPLARGDRIEVGGKTLRVPLPRGYVNVWQIGERVIQSNPNLEDVDRLKLGIRVKDLRMIEVTKASFDDSVNVTPKLFEELMKEFRVAPSSNPQRVDTVVRDDERAYCVLQTLIPSQGGEGFVAGIGFLRLNDRVVGIRITSSPGTQDVQGAIANLAREWIDLLVNAN